LWKNNCRNARHIIKPGKGVSICLDRVSIETLNLDTGREPVSTVEKISTLKKVGLDTKDVLDLDLEWSQLSRLLGLQII
jgi:hypothetical protein